MNQANFYMDEIITTYKNWKRYRIYLLTTGIAGALAGICLWIFRNDSHSGQSIMTGCLSGVCILLMNWNRCVDIKYLKKVFEELEGDENAKDTIRSKMKTI